ncbi:MAG: hypothetical protein RLZZ597_3445, partial [Cyanobacteriota bacterium]
MGGPRGSLVRWSWGEEADEGATREDGLGGVINLGGNTLLLKLLHEIVGRRLLGKRPHLNFGAALKV